MLCGRLLKSKLAISGLWMDNLGRALLFTAFCFLAKGAVVLDGEVEVIPAVVRGLVTSLLSVKDSAAAGLLVAVAV